MYKAIKKPTHKHRKHQWANLLCIRFIQCVTCIYNYNKRSLFLFEIAMFINTEGLHVISFFLLAIIHDKEFSGSRFSRWYVTGRLFFSRDLTLSWVQFLSILISLYKQGINLRWISKRCVRQYWHGLAVSNFFSHVLHYWSKKNFFPFTFNRIKLFYEISIFLFT